LHFVANFLLFQSALDDLFILISTRCRSRCKRTSFGPYN